MNTTREYIAGVFRRAAVNYLRGASEFEHKLEHKITTAVTRQMMIVILRDFVAFSFAVLFSCAAMYNLGLLTILLVGIFLWTAFVKARDSWRERLCRVKAEFEISPSLAENEALEVLEHTEDGDSKTIGASTLPEMV